MKKKTIIITMVLVVLITITALAGGMHSVKWYKKLVKRERIARVKEYWNENLTCEILQNRGDDIIIEKIIGTVVNDGREGRIMNPADPKYNYISYTCVEGARKGDVILTVCIYQPGNDFEDDVCQRFDYIIDRTEW